MNRPGRLLAGCVLALGMLALGSPLLADDFYVNTGSNVSLFDISSVVGGGTTSTASFGPLGAITSFPDAMGNVWVVTYNSGVSTVQKYDGSGDPMAGAEFQVAAALQNGVAGPGGNLYFSSSLGQIYEYSSNTLTQITDWDIVTGNPNLVGQGMDYTAVGIASDGTNLYTTEGDQGGFIDEWSANGTFDSSVDVGISGMYGLGLAGGYFFAGYTDAILQLDASGNFLNSYSIGGNNYSFSAGVDPSPVGAVPEPGTSPLVLLAGLALAISLFCAKRAQIGLWTSLHCARSAQALVGTLAFLALPAAYGRTVAALNLSINPSPSTTAAIGQTITVSASASDPSNSGGTFTYQFKMQPPGSTSYYLIRDFSPANTFPFTTTGSEGVYTIQVIAQESNGATTTETTGLTFTPVATTAPVVSPTAHPLVAMYSLPPCPVGSQARVHFRLNGALFWTYTPYQNCTGNTSLNFLIGGMRANSTYTLQQDIFSNPTDALGPVMTFTTGAIPSNAQNAIPQHNVSVAGSGPNATAYPVLLTAPVGGGNFAEAPFAADLSGTVTWYLPDFTSTLQVGAYLTHPVPGGTFLAIVNQAAQGDKQLLREYDLAGNILRETNVAAISAELEAMGKEGIDAFSHEIFRFPNGDTGLIANVEKVFGTAYDSNINTVHSNVDVLGDMAIVLDSNLRVKWAWDQFDHATQFDSWKTNGSPLPAYTGVLNETCSQNPGCPPLKNIDPNTGQLYTVANDWTHSNSLAPTPDGNLIMSIRHQDMVVKINYSNGSGDGSILWRLGPQGDFALSIPAGQTAYEFFNSHEHDAEYTPTGLISLFDNGNTRNSLYGGDSRGQAWQINDSDPSDLTATRVVNVDLGAFSSATGSAQRLANNNYHFYLGYINPNSQSVEVTTSGATQFELQQPNTLGYRSFRMSSLYSISGQVTYTPFFEVPLGN